jgi:hypothetical protein
MDRCTEPPQQKPYLQLTALKNKCSKKHKDRYQLLNHPKKFMPSRLRHKNIGNNQQTDHDIESAADAVTLLMHSV